MSNQDNINSFLDSMDEAPADQFTAAENSFASPVGNPQQAPYTPAAVWPGEQQNEPVPQTAVQPTSPAPQPQVMPQPQTVPQAQAIPQQASPMQVINPPVEQSAVNTGAQQSSEYHYIFKHGSDAKISKFRDFFRVKSNNRI